MKSNLHKAGRAILALVMLLSVMASTSMAETKPPTHDGGINFWNTEFIGVKNTSIYESTTPKALFNGAGILYGICVSGPTPASYGKYALAFDSNAALAVGANTVTVDSRVNNITLPTYANADSSSAAVTFNPGGCWWPKYPVQFNTGLIGITNSSTIGAQFYYRPATGLNP